MGIHTLFLALAIHAIAASTDDFIALATSKHGAFGGKAARFLVEHMPETDKEGLSSEFLTANLDLALKARATFPWAKDVPEEIFLNDVLPYAVFDEPRDPWRVEFLEKATPLVEDAKTAPFTAKEADRNLHDIRATDLQPVPALDDDSSPLAKDLAPRAVQLVYETIVASQKHKRAAELEAKSITLGDKTLRWLEKTFGNAPPSGRSLWISMHGGGEAPTRINDQQWRNQIQLYQPEEGIYVAPRAPTDKWNMWHQEHIDPMFSRLIENMVALRGVDPDKIYLMGYSAGGDGVWQVAPRMADRFAAASMMAGHPNESSLLGLRNLPFAIFMGANDAAVNRNKVAVEKSAELAALQQADPGGYVHLSRIYPGLPHWMNRKDAEAVPWMAKFTRNPWPKKIIWFQDDVLHHRFYWLQVPEGTAKKGQKITAEIDGRSIRIAGDVPPGTRVLLSDELLDLNEPVGISINGQATLSVKPVRSLKTIREALEQQLDPAATPTAVIVCP